MARALADFIEQGGVHGGLPPVAGTLPDMKSDTESFVKLQTM